MAAPTARAGRATLRMVAEEAGVSTATVSYVVSGRAGRSSGVSTETARRVREAADRLGYRPNPAARSMRTGKTGVVLLSLTMLSDPWSQAVAEAVNRALTPHGMTTLIMADSDWHPVLLGQPCDVAFLDAVPDTPKVKEQLADLVDRGHRLVIFNEQLDPGGFDVIRSSAMPSSRLAMEHLLERHTKIGCLTASTRRGKAYRYHAYTSALAAAGLTSRKEYVEVYPRDAAGAYAAAMKLLTLPDRPTAIFATTDFAAIGAIHAAQRLRLRVPEDVAVVGVGNTLESEQMDPALSTVGPSDFFDRLAEIIRARAVGEDASPGRLHEFPWTLFSRDST